MARTGFVSEETRLGARDLVELVKGLSELSESRFTLIGPDEKPIVSACPIMRECLATAQEWKQAIDDTQEVAVSPCPYGQREGHVVLRAVSAIALPGQAPHYLIGCLGEVHEIAQAEARLRRSVLVARDLVRAAIRRHSQLDGLAREALLRYEELNLLYETSEFMISGMSVDDIALYMLEKAMETTEAEGGAIALLEEGERDPSRAEADYLTVQVALGWGRELAPKGKRFLVGEGAIGHAVIESHPQVLEDVLDGQLYGDGSHVVELPSMLCIPLLATSRLVGAMILVNKRGGGLFTAGDEKLGWAIATQAAIAIENSKLQDRIREEERITSSLQRYVSPTVGRAVLERGGLQELIGDRWLATILFVDIRNFSVAVERTPPDVMIAVLNEYFREMTEIIFRYDGAIDEFAGDQLLTFFGIPVANPKGAENAVRAAVEIVQKMEELRGRWRAKGWPTFRVGLGITTGWVAVGNIGSEMRMELTVIGPPVVIASRVEELNKLFGTQILITQDTFERVRDIITYRDLGEAALKGIGAPVHVYEVTGLRKTAATL